MTINNKNSDHEFETQAIRNQLPGTQYKEHSTPIYLSSSFTYDSAEDMAAVFAGEKDDYAYSRYNNPNYSELVSKICSFEKAESGMVCASGMTAVFNSLFAVLKPGDHILSCANIFGPIRSLFTKTLKQWEIETSFFAPKEVNDLDSLVQENTKVLFAETPTNPDLELVDLEKLGRLAKAHDLQFIVDNTFATPYLQNPIDFGAHIVVHSTTKLIDGQGRTCGGVIVGKKDLIEKIFTFAKVSGGTMSPFHAWLLSKSIETLAVRVDRQCENALTLAKWLQAHKLIKNVNYPFLPENPQYKLAKKQMKQGGNVVSFELKGELKEGQKFINAIKLCSRTTNLGDAKTIVTHPASTTHSSLSPEDRAATGIKDTLIRVSVGLENTKDIISDINQALSSCCCS